MVRHILCCKLVINYQEKRFENAFKKISEIYIRWCNIEIKYKMKWLNTYIFENFIMIIMYITLIFELFMNIITECLDLNFWIHKTWNIKINLSARPTLFKMTNIRKWMHINDFK